MGGCCVYEKTISEYVEEVELLSKANLILFKALIFAFIERGNLGMAMKLLNVRNITRRYYFKVSRERTAKLKFESSFDEEELVDLKSTLAAEKKELLDAHTVLMSKYKLFTHKKLAFLTNYKSYLEKRQLNSSYKNSYKRLKEKHSTYETKGEEISKLCKILNSGKELTCELEKAIHEISSVTSHIANNNKRGISYFHLGSHSTELQNSNHRAKKRNELMRKSKNPNLIPQLSLNTINSRETMNSDSQLQRQEKSI